ncbi:hypothetical protein [Burkholderia cenocepacia]|uniref:hypothetical protein n=1 Tax=Burkholderia cenocepacia TaxID=95486 RepID=UPI0022303EDE|nr:hypothetical protein [Burkholderia cenocepacia]MCW3609138.1 hypothetical protein [Burkholderia cenocepacia]MCW5189862.1 hypothetical protein [Burkholderia cenocepacia]
MPRNSEKPRRKRPREQLIELYEKGFTIADGKLTVFEGELPDIPEDAYWIDETLAVTPLRIDVNVVSTTEKALQAEAALLQRRSDSEQRHLKRTEKRIRRANERRLLELGTNFDKRPALDALGPHAEKLAQFGLLEEYEVYVSRIIEKHFPSYVVAAAPDAAAIPSACTEAQAAFLDKRRHKITRLLAEVPKLEQREKIRAEFELRTGLKLLFSAEVTQLAGGTRFLAKYARDASRSYLSPVGNQRLYARDDVEREQAARRKA